MKVISTFIASGCTSDTKEAIMRQKGIGFTFDKFLCELIHFLGCQTFQWNIIAPKDTHYIQPYTISYSRLTLISFLANQETIYFVTYCKICCHYCRQNKQQQFIFVHFRHSKCFLNIIFYYIYPLNFSLYVQRKRDSPYQNMSEQLGFLSSLSI